MFIKRKRNRSGTVSIVVAEKTSGYYKELTTIGIARTQEEIDTLIMKGRKWIDAEWDGLKGYLTNTNIPVNDVYAAYHNLWHVERDKTNVSLHKAQDRSPCLYLLRGLESLQGIGTSAETVRYKYEYGQAARTC